MERETKLSSVEHQLLSLILPSGLLDYFEIKSARDIKVAYEVLLVEKSDIPTEYINKPMRCHGFYPEQTIHNFPLRGKVFDLIVKRLRWLNATTQEVVSRDWDLIAKGTRFMKEFASFFKELPGYSCDK